MEKLDMQTTEITEKNIDKLAALFPHCITEVKEENGTVTRGVDFNLLKQEFSNSVVEGPRESYSINWPGKKASLISANAPISKTLRPCREESVDFDTTENLYIEGDNLEALKLLQESYLGKIKMIYIDPPYNTGKDFVYKDNFTRSEKEELEQSGQRSSDGGRLMSNTETNGRFHSDWLSMIYPRLKLARNLLQENGTIFISLDEGEIANLRKICDEIFGEDNFIECITWNKRIPKNDKGVGNIHEYILVYIKNAETKPIYSMRKDGLDDIYSLINDIKRKKISLDLAEKEIKKLYKKNAYDRGITLYNSFDKNYKLWGKINMSWPNANTFGPYYEVLHPITKQPVKIPDRGWRWKKSTFEEAANLSYGVYKSVDKLHDGSMLCGKIWFSSSHNMQPSSVTYLDEVNEFLLRSILSFKSDGGIEIEKIFDGKSFFSYPKPTSLLKILLGSMPSKQGEIYLDFFSGSSTTADAIIQLNAEDKVDRKFIMIQLNEDVDEKSEAYKAGYKNICEIGKERIRRAGKKIKEENEDKDGIENLDIGFRVLKIDSSNMKDVYYTPDQMSQSLLDSQESNVKENRTDEDLLFQILLDWGIDLTLPIRRENINNKEVYFVDEDTLAACFADDIDEEFVKELAKRKAMRVVFKESGFKSDEMKINIDQIFTQLSPDTEVRGI